MTFWITLLELLKLNDFLETKVNHSKTVYFENHESNEEYSSLIKNIFLVNTFWKINLSN